MPQSESRPTQEPGDTDPEERRSARARTRVMEPETAEFRHGLD